MTQRLPVRARRPAKSRKLPMLELPSMRCDEGCGACCGPVPVTRREADRIKTYVAKRGIEPTIRPPETTCAFFDGRVCTIHPVRPLLCRVFGHTPKLLCKRGYNVNLPDARIRKAIVSQGPAVGYLNDVVVADGE